MPRYRKKVCRECGRVYLRRYVRTSGTMGWCGPSCYMKDYQRRRKGKAAGEPPDPIDDSAFQEPQAMAAHAGWLQEDPPQEATMAESEEAGALDLDIVADRPLVSRTRFKENNSVGVEWVGRCWAWLTEGEAPVLLDVVVKDREVVKLLEPGEVRRVRATERAVETPDSTVDGLEVWMEFEEDPEPDRSAAARGLREGEKVRIADRGMRGEMKSKIGTLIRFTMGVVEVDGRRYGMGLRDLEPVESPEVPPTGVEGTEAVPNGS